MTVALALIFLSVTSILVAAALDQQLMNQKMQAAVNARIIAFNSAEAGLIAEEARINGEEVNLSDIKGQLNHYVSSDISDNCEQHTLTIVSNAIYRNARAKLTESYLKVPPKPLVGCPNSTSHRLSWRDLDY